jgi:hypothetical protein
MSAQALFNGGEHDVAPGNSMVLQLSVANLDDSTETFALAPSGLAASWVTIRPATITLFGGTHQTVEVEVRPPRLFTTTPGPTGLTVRVVPLSDPDDVATAETRLVIGNTNDRQLSILQPALRARRRATFEAMLENQGNTQASCRLHLIDPTGRVDGDFDPPSLGVEPGANAVVRLKLRANRLQWDRRSRTIQFNVDADQPNVSTVTSAATFVQAPMLPERLYPRLLGAALGGAALAAAWFGLVKPAINDAVASEVAARPATTVVVPQASDPADNAPTDTSDITGNSNPTETTPIVVPQPVDNGTSYFRVLSAPAAAGATSEFIETVPAGQLLEITDIVAQNPGADGGSMGLRIGGNQPLAWDLLSMSDLRYPLSTPIVLQPGDTLTLTVRCDSVGQTTNDACVSQVVINGVLRPVE